MGGVSQNVIARRNTYFGRYLSLICTFDIRCLIRNAYKRKSGGIYLKFYRIYFNYNFTVINLLFIIFFFVSSFFFVLPDFVLKTSDLTNRPPKTVPKGATLATTRLK